MKRQTGTILEDAVEGLGRHLGLTVLRQFKLGRRITGRERLIDIIFRNNDKNLAIECKFQGGSGSAEDKIIASLEDLKCIPTDRAILAHAGPGFRDVLISHLAHYGTLIAWSDLQRWVELHFNLTPRKVIYTDSRLDAEIKYWADKTKKKR